MASGDPDGDFLLKTMMSKKDVYVFKAPKSGGYLVGAGGVTVYLRSYSDERSTSVHITRISVGNKNGSVSIDVSDSWLSTLTKWMEERKKARTASLYAEAIAALCRDGKEDNGNG